MTAQKIGEVRYEVDFGYLPDGTPEYIKWGFTTEVEAQTWATENTEDGRVFKYTRIW